ncbi:kinase that interacts with cdc31p [Basidiobolus ranarum]|uniref:non-specific serine/threonine protein kinase n=1 Tax=Basidiobolus ranarum TaxID=34480 RepID=A0ABR2W9I2_9FUNG
MHNFSTEPKVSTLYVKKNLVGRGAYGKVYKGIEAKTGKVIAIKILDLDSDDDVTDIQREINLLSQLKRSDSQNITKYHGSYLEGTKLWIIMDYAAGGSIRDFMEFSRIEEKYIALIAKEVLMALSYLHKTGIIHRDIKAANILLTEEGRVQLCDFGVARQISLNSFKRYSFVGTPYWMAPEVIQQGSKYDFKADIWSFGITLFEIATGNPPYADQNPKRALYLIPRNKPIQLEGNFSSILKEFIRLCLANDPNDRPSADELMKTKFIKSASKYPEEILKELVVRLKAYKETTKSSEVERLEISDEELSSTADGSVYQEPCPEEAWNFDQLPQTTSLDAPPEKDGSDQISETVTKPQNPYSDLHPLARLFADVDSTKDDNQSIPCLSNIDSKSDVLTRTMSEDPITIDFSVPCPNRARMSRTLNDLPSNFSSSLPSFPSIDQPSGPTTNLLVPSKASKFHSINMTNPIPLIMESTEGELVKDMETKIPQHLQDPSMGLRSTRDKEKRNSIDLLVEKRNSAQQRSIQEKEPPRRKDKELYKNHVGNSSDTKLLRINQENRPQPRRVMSSFNMMDHEDDGLPLKALFGNKQTEPIRALRYGSESELNQFNKAIKSTHANDSDLSARRRTKSLTSEKSSLLVPIQIPNGEGFSPTLLLPPSPSTPNVHRLSNSLALPIGDASKFRIGPEIRPLNYESLVTYDEVVAELANSMEILEKWTEMFEDSLRNYRFPES